MKVSQEQITYMIRSCVIDKKTTYQIGKDLNLSNVTIGKYLRENGILLSSQKYKFNEHYFNQIDTSNKSYFLGFIYADGSINNKKNSCAIKLTETDRYILEQLKLDINSNKPLYYRKSEPIIGTSYIGRSQLKLELNSKFLIDDLLKWGVFPNKSMTLVFPIDMPNIKDFIRGYFDGDGCIYNSQGRIMLNFVGNEKFLRGLSQFLYSELQIISTPKKNKKGNSWYLYIFKINDVLKFCQYIYQDNNCIKLIRKYEKFENYLKEKGLI